MPQFYFITITLKPIFTVNLAARQQLKKSFPALLKALQKCCTKYMVAAEQHQNSNVHYHAFVRVDKIDDTLQNFTRRFKYILSKTGMFGNTKVEIAQHYPACMDYVTKSITHTQAQLGCLHNSEVYQSTFTI